MKSSTPASVRERMRECLEIIMKKTESDMHSFIEEFRNEFKKLPKRFLSVNSMTEYADKVALYVSEHTDPCQGSLIYNHLLKEKSLEKKYPLIHK